MYPDSLRFAFNGSPQPLLQWITPLSLLSSQSACAAFRAGVDVIQIRDLRASVADLENAVSELRRCADRESERAARQKFASLNVNAPSLEQLHARLQSRAPEFVHALHFPERWMECSQEWCGQRILLVCSVHSVQAARNAHALEFNYLQVGTMFETQTHVGKQPEGP